MSNNDIFSLTSCYLNQTCNPTQLKAICDKNPDKYCGANTCINKTSLPYTSNCSSSPPGSVRIPTDTLQQNFATTLADLQLAQSDEEKVNNSRLLEINTYYGKKRLAQNYILKTFCITMITIFALWLLGSYFPVIPSWLISLSMSFTIAIGFLIILFKSVDISKRNNLDYDKYDIEVSTNLPPINPVSANQGSISSIPSSSALATYGGKTCSNQKCCPTFFTFNQSLGYCGLNPFV